MFIWLKTYSLTVERTSPFEGILQAELSHRVRESRDFNNTHPVADSRYRLCTSTLERLVKVPREQIRISGRWHQHDAQRRMQQQDITQDEQQQVWVERPLMHLVYDYMSQLSQRPVIHESAEQYPSGAEKEARLEGCSFL